MVLDSNEVLSYLRPCRIGGCHILAVLYQRNYENVVILLHVQALTAT